MKLNQFACTVICLISVSCSGQVKTDAPKEIRTSGTEQPKLIRSQGTNEYANVHCSLEDKNGKLWFGTTGEGLYCYNGTSFVNFLEKDGLGSNNVWCIYEDKGGNLLFGTDNGVCYYNTSNESFTYLPIEETLTASGTQKNPVHAIFQDKTGEFWFGTDQGVFRFKGSIKNAEEDKAAFTKFLSDDYIINEKKLKLNSVSAILQDRSGKIWFASWNNEGACSYDGRSITSFSPNGDNMVYSLLQDKNGNLWFGTREHGVCRYDWIGSEKSYTNFADIPTFSASCVYSMVEDKTGTIWFGTEFGSGSLEDAKGGVWRYNPSNNAFTNFTVKGDALTNNSVFTVLKDHSDEFWFGTRNMGLCKFDPTAKGKKFIVFSE